MDTGVVGLTSWQRVLSALSIAGGSLEVTRSQVVFHFHFYFLLCHRGEERLCRQRWAGQPRDDQDSGEACDGRAIRAGEPSGSAWAGRESACQVLVLERENVLS